LIKQNLQWHQHRAWTNNMPIVHLKVKVTKQSECQSAATATPASEPEDSQQL